MPVLHGFYVHPGQIHRAQPQGKLPDRAILVPRFESRHEADNQIRILRYRRRRNKILVSLRAERWAPGLKQQNGRKQRRQEKPGSLCVSVHAGSALASRRRRGSGWGMKEKSSGAILDSAWL